LDTEKERILEREKVRKIEEMNSGATAKTKGERKLWRDSNSPYRGLEGNDTERGNAA